MAEEEMNPVTQKDYKTPLIIKFFISLCVIVIPIVIVLFEVRFELVRIGNEYHGYYVEEYGLLPNIDQRIIGEKNNGQMNTIIESVRNYLHLPESEILKQIAVIPESNLIVFVQTGFGSELSSDNLFEFNGATNKIEKLKISQDFSGSGVLVVSPDQKKAAHVGAKSDYSKMYLFDFVTDTDSVISEIGGSEIMSNGSSRERGLKIEWIDNNILDYGIFDRTNSFIDSDILMHSFIGRRRAFVKNQCEDTDGGDNVYRLGIINGPLLTTGAAPSDYCVSGLLVEYSCSSNGGYNQNDFGIYSRSVNCEFGCVEGVCTKGPSLPASTEF